MSDAAKRRATYEDLRRLPENLTGEIVNGDLVATPRPSIEHSHAAAVIGGDLVPPFGMGRGGGPGGWLILPEPELLLTEHVLVPDLAGWRRERLAGRPKAEWMTIPPDWVCEILSPSTALRDRTVKKGIYEAHGVGHLWLVDPWHMTLEVFRLESDRLIPVRVVGGQDRVRLEPFEEIELFLGDWWLQA